MKKIAYILIGLASAFALLMPLNSFSAESGFVLGGFDFSRGGYYSFPSGPYLSQARTSLTASFPGASFASFPALTPEVLAGVDILAISSATSNGSHVEPLSPSEQNALFEFVRGGGCAILFPDNSTFGGAATTPAANESLIDPFGMDIDGTLIGGVTATVIDPAGSPVTAGPFGTIGYFSQNYPGGLTNLGPYAAPLATNPLGHALAVIDSGILDPGSGAVIVYTDINTFGDNYAAGFYPGNESLFLNTISFCLRSIPVEVVIDIKPGSDPNCFNNNGFGAIPVAVFGSSGFDVRDIEPSTIRLESMPVKVVGNSLLVHYEDINLDGFEDLVAQIQDIDGVFSEGAASATLTGKLYSGTQIKGTDSICIVP